MPMTPSGIRLALAAAATPTNAAPLLSALLSQLMEQRYSALADVHGKVAAEKDKLQRDNESLREVCDGWGECRVQLAQLLSVLSRCAVSCRSTQCCRRLPRLAPRRTSCRRS